MRTNYLACFGALTLLMTACADDQQSSSSPDRMPVPVATDGPTAETYAVMEAATEATAARVPEINPVTDPAVDALSTFAIDVDTGSYTRTRAMLDAGYLPSPDEVRTEEFVNAFEQDYAQPADGPFAVSVDGTAVPFLDDGTVVLRVGVQGMEIDDSARRDANLTFVIDVSGSMGEFGKLDAVKPALDALVESLRPTDRVAIVVYSDETRVVLDPTPVERRQDIMDAIYRLETEGATSVEGGLTLGYSVARESYDPERINRVILLSDGVANVGATGSAAILEIIGDGARDGIDLVTVGFGLGEYNDTLMEQLADKGDGFYAYVDGQAEAVRLFSHDLTGTLQVIGRDAKIQVEFNPATVATYRLLGFENRQIADRDFRDDSVDGGEVGAGHTVTALYEVRLVDGFDADADPTAWVARATLRWLHPDTRNPNETGAGLAVGEITRSLAEAPPRLVQDILVASFAETLRGSGWSGRVGLAAVAEDALTLSERLDDPALAELASLVTAAARLRG